ncbi:MAG: hypothetical protein PHW04_11605 [Candidatus Wallbacteria bacterium]|nr:hypothetical protein [Candidatus Wallbacteria bacterium]
MKKMVLVMLLCLMTVEIWALTGNDVQVVFNEDSINLVLREALKDSKLQEPALRFFNNGFSFEGIYPFSILFMPVADIPIKFVGDMAALNGDVLLNIAEYIQNGERQDKSTTISRIRTIVQSINEACSNAQKPVNISAEYIPSSKYCGSVRLNLKQYSVIPAMPGLQIRKIVLEPHFFTVSSSPDTFANNNAEIQAYVGENVINELLKLYTRPRVRNVIKVSGISLDVGDKSSRISINYLQADNASSNILIDVNAEVPKLNLINLLIRNYSGSAGSFDGLMAELVNLVNANIKAMPSPVKGERMQFTYLNRKITFNANFDDIIPLKIKPDIFHISGRNDCVSVFGQLNPKSGQ